MKTSARNFGLLFVLLSVFEIATLSLGVTSIHPWIKPLLIPTLAAAALCTLLPEHRGWRTVVLAGIHDKLHGWKEVLLWAGPVALAPGLIASCFDVNGVLRGMLVVYTATLLYLIAEWLLVSAMVKDRLQSGKA